MAAGTVVYQSATLATPPATLAVMADAVNDSDHGAGTTQYIKIMDGATAGTAKAGVTTANGLAVDVTRVQGTVQALGTMQPLAGSVHVANTISGTVQTHGTSQALGTVQPLAGSVHVANTLTGTFQSHGTNQALGTIQPLAGSVHVANVLSGTFQVHGTAQIIGTVQPLAGSVHLAAGSVFAQGVVAHGAAAAGNPVLIGGFGSSGTQAAVDDGDLVRPWFDLNGRLQIRGTIDSLPNVTIGAGDNNIGNVDVVTMPTVTVTATNLDIRDLSSASDSVSVVGTVQTHGTTQAIGTFQAHGTAQVIGTVQGHGTFQALGTTQPLAGSVHLATNLAGGTVVAVGSALHGAAADTRPLLIAAFGSSGTQAAIDDGDAVRLWADLNGRLQIRGTIDSLVGTVQTHGTSQVLGTTQPLAGSVHLASALPGGTVQTHGTSQVLGSVQTVGTSQALGTTQPLAGSVHVANTAAIAGTVRTRPVAASEGFFGTRFTAAVTNGTLVPAPAQGTYVRVWGLVASGSAAGTAFFEFGDGTIFGAIFTAANGGMVYTSAKGIRTNGTTQDIFFNCAAGTWGVSVEYSLET